MTNRQELPMRRHAETFTVDYNNMLYVVTIGRYPSGAIGEVFINFEKSGTMAEAIARDGAVLMSLGLQYGVPLENLKSAVTRDARGGPSSIVGAVVDKLLEGL